MIIKILNYDTNKSSALFKFRSGFNGRDVQKDVEVHGKQEAVGICSDIRRGYPAGSPRRLCLSDGIDHAGLHCPEGL